MDSNETRRRILQVAGSTAVASLAGCASVANQMRLRERASTDDAPKTVENTPTATRDRRADQTGATDQPGTTDSEPTTEAWSTADVSIGDPSIDLSSVPLPETDVPYPRMGPTDGPTATVYGNWKCPYTQEFALEILPEIVEDYVEPGRIGLEFRTIAYLDGAPNLGPDAPRASRAGIAVWNVDPDSFWDYFAYVFANQPAEKHAWAQADLLTRLADAADVSDPKTVREQFTADRYDGLVRRSVDDAATLGIGTVPRIAVDGSVTAPTVNLEETRRQLERAADRSTDDRGPRGDRDRRPKSS